MIALILIIYQVSSCQLCLQCSIDICAKCIPNASLTSTMLDCSCNPGFAFNVATNSCIQCTNGSCQGCKANGSYPDPYSITGQCLCPSGYYLNNAFCLPCKPTCLQCTVSFCITCLNNMIFDSVANDGSCRCQDGYYLQNLACKPCDSSCSQCNSTDCLTCSSRQATISGAKCVCMTGFYLDSNGACLACDFSCSSCNATSCSQCFSPFGRIAGKFCLCPLGMYTTNANRTCLNCPSNCSACTGLNNCLSCVDQNAVVVNGGCLCNTGYLLVNGSCVKCDVSCKACDSNSNCLACLDPNSHVASNNTCQCNPGFYQCTVCKPCDPTCISCNYSTCFNCKYNNSALAGISCSCNDGFYLTNTGCSKCDARCLTCNNSTCLSCPNYAQVINGICQCFGNREFVNGSCLCKAGYLGNETCEKCFGYMNGDDFIARFNPVFFSIEIELSYVPDFADRINCSLIFEAETLAGLGNGPLCTWEDEEKTIYVVLGKFANISEKISLKSSFFISSEKTCTLNRTERIEITLLTIGNGPDSDSHSAESFQSYSIIGPTKLSKKCSSQATFYFISLDGSKNIKDFVWTSVPAVPVKQSGQKVVFNLSNIETEVLEVNVTKNYYIGESYYYTFIVDIYSNFFLQVVIKNGNYIQTRSSSELLVEAFLADDCGMAENEVWKWDLLTTSQPIDNAELILANATGNNLYIPAGTLKCDINYTFSLNVTKGASFGCSVFYVFTRPEGLIIMLSRGSGSISMVSDTAIDASQSCDPSQMELTYSWQMTNYSGPYSDNCSSLLIESKYLTENQQIFVTLTIKTMEMSASKTLILTPVNLDVSVKYMYTDMRVNLPETISINFQSSSPCRYFWQDASSRVLSTSTLLSVPRLNYLTSYSFVISCNSSKYIAELDIVPNLPAECLNFSLSSYTVNAYNETISVDAFHCFDGDESDYPLKYSYSINNSDLCLVLVSDSYESKHDFVMFPGSFFVLFDVCDYLGMCSHYKSETLNVIKNNNTVPKNLFNNLKNNINAAVIISGYNSTLDEVTKQYIWSNLTNLKLISSSDFKSFLSSAQVLAKMDNFNFTGFIDILESNKLVFDESAVRSFSDVHSKLLTNDLEVSQVFKLNSFLVEGLRSGVSSLGINEVYKRTYENLTIYKQRYTDSSALPSYLSNTPSVEGNQIMNIQVIKYSSPYPAVSVLFTKSGSLVNSQYSLEPEQKIIYKDIGLLLTLPCPNITGSVCMYSNETGSYPNEGCSIISMNSTHATLNLTHTSFFYVSQQKNSPSSDCPKFYLPAYLLNILIITIPILIIIFKIVRGSEPETEEQVELKSVNHEEEHREVQRTPSRVSEIQPTSRVSLLEFHLYFGAYYNGNFYFSSLKMFSILCCQISNLFFVGVFLTSLEDVKVNSEVPVGSVLHFGGIAFVLTLPIQLSLHYTFAKPRRSTGYVVALGFSLGVVFSVIASVYIVIYNYYMCETWAKAWCVVYAFTIIYELIFHSVGMLVLYAAKDYIFKIIK